MGLPVVHFEVIGSAPARLRDFYGELFVEPQPLLEQLHPGDVLLVSERSRLGRSVGQIIQLIDRLIQQRVRLIAIKENIHLNGPQDMQTKVMVTLLSLFAEIERDLIAERTKEGLAAARAKGRLPGRPKGVQPLPPVPASITSVPRGSAISRR
jgi:DNA invertase Pin-like site-specific DNA recombinase